MLDNVRLIHKQTIAIAALMLFAVGPSFMQPAQTAFAQPAPGGASKTPSAYDDTSDFADANRIVYLSNIQTNTVTAYDGLGRQTRQISGFGRPVGIDVAPNGDLYVADNGHNTIEIFARRGLHPYRTLRIAGKPIDVKVSRKGIVAVVDANGSVLFYRVGADRPCRTVDFPHFRSLNMGAFDDVGNFFVDGFSPRIITSVARMIGGCLGGATVQSDVPNIGQVGGIAVNSQGQVVIADADQRTLFTYAYTKRGRLAIVKTTTLVDTGIPWAFSFTPDRRHVFVADGRGGWESYPYPFARSAVHKASSAQEPFGIAIAPDSAR